MKKGSLILVFLLALFSLTAQQRQVSLNYSYLGTKSDKDLGADGNHGMSLQAVVPFSGQFFFNPVLSYYFKKGYTSHYFAEANVGFAIPLVSNKLTVSPLVGAGLSNQHFNGTVFIKGSPNAQPYPIPDAYQKIKDNRLSLRANMGVLVSLQVTDNIILNTGAKYMLGVHENDQNFFPTLHVGVGYKF